MAAFRNIFKSIPIRKPKRNIFDLSFDNLLTCNFGELVPVLCKEVLPGDTWQVQSATMIRFAPMIAPIMHRVNVYIHYFFVPNRLLWSDFEDFITGGKDGTFTAPIPSITIPDQGDMSDENFKACFGERSLWDYLGLPTRPDNELSGFADALENFKSKGQISALPFLAYNKIYSDYYRDENLEEEIDVKSIADSPGGLDPLDSEGFALMQKRNRAWEKDYFSSALPWPQRGGDVHLPLQGDADVVYQKNGAMGKHQEIVDVVTGRNVGEVFDSTPPQISADDVEHESWLKAQSGSSSVRFDIDPNGTLKTDLSTATATTVNELRRALRLQEWLEKNARSGVRYIEQILAHFGVRSSDARLDRSEYLGGGKCPVQIGSVFQTSATGQDGPLADMAGRGVATGSSNKFKKFFEEHGYVMGIMSIIPRSSYGNGIPKHFTKNDKFDFAWPEFANLGEQEIKSYELNLTGDPDDDFATFGYTPRYADYKFSLNEFHGDFRSSLAYWHLGRMFDYDSPTLLNDDFVHVDQTRDNLNRIFAVQDPANAHLWCEVYNQITVARTLPKFGVPTL